MNENAVRSNPSLDVDRVDCINGRVSTEYGLRSCGVRESVCRNNNRMYLLALVESGRRFSHFQNEMPTKTIYTKERVRERL